MAARPSAEAEREASWQGALLSGPFVADVAAAPSFHLLDDGAESTWSSAIAIPQATTWTPPWPATPVLLAPRPSYAMSMPAAGLETYPTIPSLATRLGAARSESVPWVATLNVDWVITWAARLMLVAVLIIPIVCAYLAPLMATPSRARAPCRPRAPEIDEPHWIVG